MHKIAQKSEIEKFDEEHMKAELKNAQKPKIQCLDQSEEGMYGFLKARRVWWWLANGKGVGDAPSRAGIVASACRSGRNLRRRVGARGRVAGGEL